MRPVNLAPADRVRLPGGLRPARGSAARSTSGGDRRNIHYRTRERRGAGSWWPRSPPTGAPAPRSGAGWPGCGAGGRADAGFAGGGVEGWRSSSWFWSRHRDLSMPASLQVRTSAHRDLSMPDSPPDLRSREGLGSGSTAGPPISGIAFGPGDRGSVPAGVAGGGRLQLVVSCVDVDVLARARSGTPMPGPVRGRSVREGGFGGGRRWCDAGGDAGGRARAVSATRAGDG